MSRRKVEAHRGVRLNSLKTSFCVQLRSIKRLCEEQTLSLLITAMFSFHSVSELHSDV